MKRITQTTGYCITMLAMGLSTLTAVASAPEAIIIGPSGDPQHVELRVSIPLDRGQHIYAADVAAPYVATAVRITAPGPVQWEKPTYPPTKTLTQADEAFSVFEPQGSESTVTLSITGQIQPGTKAGRYPIAVAVTWQACTESMCLPPVMSRPLSAELILASDVQATENTKDTTEPSAATPPAADSSSPAGYGTQFAWFGVSADLQKLPIIAALALAALAGLILNIMPCVLPVIPLKAMQLIQDAGREGRSAKIIGLYFSAGVISFFVAIGVVAIGTHGALSWGRQFQSVAFLQGMAAMMVWLAMGMFGVYLVQPVDAGGSLRKRSGYLKAIGSGWVAGVISTPCSFGLLGAAVVWAQLQSPAVTLLAFAAMGAGMALPVMIVTIWPALLGWIPRTGLWAERVKQAMGFVLLAVAAFFVGATPGERVAETLYLLIAISMACWIWGAVQYSVSPLAWIVRVAVIAGVIGSGWLAMAKSSTALPWTPLTEASLAAAEASGKTLVVEFTAEWCLNCKTVEKLTLSDRQVQNELNSADIVLLKGDRTTSNPFAEAKLKEWTGQTGIPFTVVFRDGKKELLPGIYMPADLLRALGRE